MKLITEALLMTSDTLMFIPLIVFCFLPVFKKTKSSLPKLIFKTVIAVIIMEILMFGVYLVSMSELAVIFNMLFCASVFFWLYQREVTIERSHLWFVFVTAGLIGSFGYMIYHISKIFMRFDFLLQFIPEFYSLITQIVFECILIMILYYPTQKYLGWLVECFHEEKVWRIVWVFPVSFIVLSKNLIPYHDNQLFNAKAMEMYFIFSLVFLSIVICLYIMFYQVAYQMVQKQEILEKTSYLEMQTEQYRQLQDHVQETKRIRHDFHHQMIVLERMIKNKDYQEAEKFLLAYCQDIDYTVKKYCDSIAVNAVLNHYVTLCQQEKVKIILSIGITDIGILRDIDFCVLLGNLLENALYGCKDVDKEIRKIELKIAQTAPHIIVLQITNPYLGVIKKARENFLSSRHCGEGQGIKSVYFIANKYDGFVKVSYDNQEFVVKVLLNI